ncbi:MAG: hypothetical protein CM1200mP41_30810 [Gammaproteobacteria bacterium]|nr:MAG: hypothetical protein CM1200mP41_30810 [Gammaproteobacteria bacterium]
MFVSEVVRVDVAAISIMVLLGLTSLVPGYSGLVPLEHLFEGYSSNAVISIIAVMIIGAGLDKTGVMSQVAGKILKYGGEAEGRVISVISVTVGVISSFMQNIGRQHFFCRLFHVLLDVEICQSQGCSCLWVSAPFLGAPLRW